MEYGGRSRKILVWFQEISLRKIYQLRLRDLLRYSDSLMASRDQVLEPGTEYRHLAAFLLKEYEAAFIAREDQDQNLEGYVFKNDTRQMIRSGPFTVPRRLPVSSGLMGEENPILSDDADFHVTKDEFLRQIPVDQTVLEAIDVPVRNYIAYNETDISIAAFNFRSGITVYEEQFFEVVVNIYRNMVTLVDLNKKLQEQSVG